MIDQETVRHHYKRYRNGVLSALQKLEAGGSEFFQDELQKQALEDFFTALHHYETELRTLITDNFEIIGST
jgi:hypothetical protein